MLVQQYIYYFLSPDLYRNSLLLSLKSDLSLLQRLRDILQDGHIHHFPFVTSCFHRDFHIHHETTP